MCPHGVLPRNVELLPIPLVPYRFVHTQTSACVDQLHPCASAVYTFSCWECQLRVLCYATAGLRP